MYHKNVFQRFTLGDEKARAEFLIIRKEYIEDKIKENLMKDRIGNSLRVANPIQQWQNIVAFDAAQQFDEYIRVTLS